MTRHKNLNFILRVLCLLRQFPDVAPELFKEAEEDAAARLASYKRLAN